MLYSPLWNKKVTLQNFAAWLETQNPRKRYDWNNCRKCAVAQWLNALGYDDAIVEDSLNDSLSISVPSTSVLVANSLACDLPRTFGALRRRVRAFLDGR